jgi:hypothetical protein
MDIEKIIELVGELEEDIRVKKEALNGLLQLIDSTNGHKVAKPVGTRVAFHGVEGDSSITFNSASSYVDLAEQLIKSNNGEDMTVKAIVAKIRLIKDNSNIERRSIESTLYQHVKNKGENSRLIKTAPGYYGIRRLPRKESTG